MYIDFYTIILFIVLLFVCLFAIYVYNNGKEQRINLYLLKLTHNIVDRKSLRKAYIKTMSKAMKQLNIVSEIDSQGTDTSCFKFQYQSGNFTLYFPKEDSKAFRMLYPYAENEQLDYLDAIRTVCNEVNTISNFARALYSFDNEEKCVYVHLLCCIPASTIVYELQGTLKEAFQECFDLHRILNDRLDSMKKEINETHFSDLEYTNKDAEQQQFWVNQAEAKHDIASYTQNDDAPSISAEDACKLGTWLEFINILPSSYSIVRLLSDSDDGYHFSSTDAEAIKHYPITEPILHKIGLQQAPKAQTGSVRIFYKRKGEDEDKEHTLTLSLENAGQKNQIVFIRINYMLPERSTEMTGQFRKSNGFSQVSGGSFMIGIDWKDGKSKRTEFDFMWKDAQDKAREGKTDEWTPEQQIISSLTHADLGYDLYFGKKFCRQHRYYEAALHLSRAYNLLNERYSSLNQNSLGVFYEVSYLLGFCYIELQQLKTAYYYLQCLEGVNHSYYLEELINCLVALKDFRSEQVISYNLSRAHMQIQEFMNNDKEVPTVLVDFYNFLRRRDIYICIEKQYLDDAEKSCKQMLNEEDNKDFALNELNYIQRLRENGIESFERPTNSDDSPF